MAELPTFKKFVSEDDIAEAKKKRQEEWEKVRQPHQPEGKLVLINCIINRVFNLC